MYLQEGQDHPGHYRMDNRSMIARSQEEYANAGGVDLSIESKGPSLELE